MAHAITVRGWTFVGTSVLPGRKHSNWPAEGFRQMSADASQSLASHVASSTCTAQLDSSNVILETKQFQITAIALHPSPDGFKRALKYVHILFCVRHFIPFTIHNKNEFRSSRQLHRCTMFHI